MCIYVDQRFIGSSLSSNLREDFPLDYYTECHLPLRLQKLSLLWLSGMLSTVTRKSPRGEHEHDPGILANRSAYLLALAI